MDQVNLNYLTVSDSVYLWIKNAIINGDLKTGERLIQEELTKKLGVSRTPVRDAFKRLESEGLVVSRPHYGSTVFQPSREMLRELYELRVLLEQYCVGRVCETATDKELQSIKEINQKMAEISPSAKEYMQLDYQFHKRYCEVSGCTSLTMEILEGLWNKCSSFKSLYFSLDNRSAETISLHGTIADCLLKRDADGAKEAVAKHLTDVMNSITDALDLS